MDTTAEPPEPRPPVDELLRAGLGRSVLRLVNAYATSVRSKGEADPHRDLVGAQRLRHYSRGSRGPSWHTAEPR